MNRKDALHSNIKIFLNRFGAQKEINSAVGIFLDFLEKQCIVIPNPNYGKIQYDLPNNYCYEHVKKLFQSHEKTMLDFFEKIKNNFHSSALDSISDEKQDELHPYWNNGFFSRDDARALYAVAATFNPSLVIEVGVGNSTKFLRKSINDNDLKTKIISIDPDPRANITRVSDRHIYQSILDVDTNIFSKLTLNDILFLDGSHVSLPGTDVPHYMLNILPTIKQGVFVHIHDIFLPWEYGSDFRRRQYNEQHMVAAMLLYSEMWDIKFAVHFLKQKGFLSQGGGSLWLRKR